MTCPALKFSLKAKPFCISSVNARAALPSPLTPCSLKTLMASMMPLNGATTNLRTALPTPITPWMILLMRPDEPRKADTFPMRSTRMSTTLSRMPERKSITGCKASIPFFKAAVAFSSSLTASASFITRETRMVKVAIAGDLARASAPSFIPLNPPVAAPSPFRNASMWSPSPLKAD